MQYIKSTQLLQDRIVWVVEIDNKFSYEKSLILSKVSEAICPATQGNHVGEGATLDAFLERQQGVRFIINGGYNHYRKNFYDWQHQNFNVGDPVGLVKIREHYFEDAPDLTNYGFFVQKKKNGPWDITTKDFLSKNEKYILGCTPLLILNGKEIKLPFENMIPYPAGKINPPSILGHGLQSHPRTAVGIKNKSIVFVVVEGDDHSGGCSLKELQELGLKLELNSFLNLDGGGSSQFRLRDGNSWVCNYVSDADRDRVLGNVIVLFEDQLKIKP